MGSTALVSYCHTSDNYPHLIGILDCSDSCISLTLSPAALLRSWSLGFNWSGLMLYHNCWYIPTMRVRERKCGHTIDSYGKCPAALLRSWSLGFNWSGHHWLTFLVVQLMHLPPVNIVAWGALHRSRDTMAGQLCSTPRSTFYSVELQLPPPLASRTCFYTTSL